MNLFNLYTQIISFAWHSKKKSFKSFDLIFLVDGSSYHSYFNDYKYCSRRGLVSSVSAY